MSLEMINWVFIIFPVLAMKEVSGPNSNLYRVNILYTIANLWSIFYFFATTQWSWLVLYVIFTIMSVRGIFTHKETKVVE